MAIASGCPGVDVVSERGRGYRGRRRLLSLRRRSIERSSAHLERRQPGIDAKAGIQQLTRFEVASLSRVSRFTRTGELTILGPKPTIMCLACVRSGPSQRTLQGDMPMKSTSSCLRHVLMATATIALMGAADERGADATEAGHVHQGRRPDLPGEVRGLSPARARSRRCRCARIEEARPWARSIRARVESRQMPPWHIDKTVGIQQFKNDRSLSDDQIATILAWVDQGARRGDPKDMPAARVWPEGQGWNYAAAIRAEGAGPDHPRPAVDEEGRARATPGSSGWSKPASPSRAGCARSKCGPGR